MSATRYALDTNVLSELRRTTPDPAVARWSRSVSVTDLFLPAVVLMELRHGAALIRQRGDAPQADGLETWIDGLVVTFDGRVLDFTADAAQFAATLTSRPDAPGLADIMIAATAQVHGMPVATRNVQDFARTGVAVLNPWES
ncbi:type II toxin-antitoxin system VapC family toxin [Demequina sp. NBRC 110051]|uniref:type II toxin-antitoxin system VapC family toxin n=1 Tax=Demequina sp. NBRC 110051 TaxID=1570340 RepID=UPI000A039E72|nr:type II toxin-antitoxin system VapC family toxin [Demequina sp. NBRC 110051]